MRIYRKRKEKEIIIKNLVVKGIINSPIVEAIMDERRPKTQEKGKEMARARGPKSDTCSDLKKDTTTGKLIIM